MKLHHINVKILKLAEINKQIPERQQDRHKHNQMQEDNGVISPVKGLSSTFYTQLHILIKMCFQL